MKKFLLLFFIGLSASVGFALNVNATYNGTYAGRPGIADTMAYQLTAIDEENAFFKDYIFLSIEILNENYAEPITGITFTIAVGESGKPLDFGGLYYSKVYFINEDNETIVSSNLSKFSPVNDGEFTDTVFIIPFASVEGLSNDLIETIHKINILFYIPVELTSGNTATIETEWYNLVDATLTAYLGDFTGEKLFIEYYIDNVLYSRQTKYTYNFTLNTIPAQTGKLGLCWQTITQVNFPGNGIILDEWITVEGEDNVLKLYALYSNISLGEGQTPTENETTSGALTEFLSIFNANNSFGFNLIWSILAIGLIILFLFKKWPVLGATIIHFLLTTIFWILGFLQIYVIVPMYLCYAIIIYSEIIQKRGSVGNE